MPFDTVLFDLDGTLVDTLPLIRDTYRKVFQAMGIPWCGGEVMSFVGVPLRDIARHFAGERYEEFFRLYQYYYSLEHDVRTRPYPGTVNILSRLAKSGCKMGVVTSKTRKVAEKALSCCTLDPFVDVLVAVDDVCKPKPEPEPVFKALDLLRSSVDRAVFVGDSNFDFQAGRRAGVMTLAVAWGITSGPALDKVDVDGVLHHWNDLKKYLLLAE
ncbi:MAG: HAD family hydrolase [Bacillota bacterium]